MKLIDLVVQFKKRAIELKDEIERIKWGAYFHGKLQLLKFMEDTMELNLSLSIMMMREHNPTYVEIKNNLTQ